MMNSTPWSKKAGYWKPNDREKAIDIDTEDWYSHKRIVLNYLWLV
jgi:hypothetical protein